MKIPKKSKMNLKKISLKRKKKSLKMKKNLKMKNLKMKNLKRKKKNEEEDSEGPTDERSSVHWHSLWKSQSPRERRTSPLPAPVLGAHAHPGSAKTKSVSQPLSGI